MSDVVYSLCVQAATMASLLPIHLRNMLAGMWHHTLIGMTPTRRMIVVIIISNTKFPKGRPDWGCPEPCLNVQSPTGVGTAGAAELGVRCRPPAIPLIAFPSPACTGTTHAHVQKHPRAPRAFIHNGQLQLTTREGTGASPRRAAPYMHIHITSLQAPGNFGNTGVPAQLRNRRGSAMRGLGYGPRIERGVVSSRLI